MVVNNIVYSSQCPRVDRGNIVYTDGIRNIVRAMLWDWGSLNCGKRFLNMDSRPVPDHRSITN